MDLRLPLLRLLPANQFPCLVAFGNNEVILGLSGLSDLADQIWDDFLAFFHQVVKLELCLIHEFRH